MPNFFRFKSFTFTVTCLLLFATLSCKKKEETVVPEDLSGTLDMTLSPANSVWSISLTQQGNSNQVAAAIPDATGYLKLTGLQAGNYVVTFTSPYDYNAPAPRNLTIAAKTNTSLGTIKVDKANTSVPYALQGNASWTSTITATGATTNAVNAAVSGNVSFYNGSPNFLAITAIYQSGTIAETVQLSTIYTGVGQYTLGNVMGAGLGTYLRTVGGATANSYDTAASGSQGTVTVTAHDLTKRTITGTFGFNAYDSRRVQGATISKGTFSVSY